MGQQHNSHVLNNTVEPIKVALTDKDNRDSTQIISPGAHVCFSTPHGRVTLFVFRQLASSQFSQNAEAVYTDDSDPSFIVKQVGDSFNIVRSVYGNIHQEATGLRSTSCFGSTRSTENDNVNVNVNSNRSEHGHQQTNPDSALQRLLWKQLKVNNT